MTIKEELQNLFPHTPNHEIVSALSRCPWNPESDRGKAYLMGYLERAFDIDLYKVEKRNDY